MGLNRKNENSCILYYLYLYIRCGFHQARKLFVKQKDKNFVFQNLLKNRNYYQ